MEDGGGDQQGKERRCKTKSKQSAGNTPTLEKNMKKGKKKNKKSSKSQASCKRKGHNSSSPSTSDETGKNSTKKATTLPRIPQSSDLQITPGDTKMKGVFKTEADNESVNIQFSSGSQVIHVNESLRWEEVLDDPVKEEERICQYKINRRKRYMLAAQQARINALDSSEESQKSLHSLQKQVTESLLVTDSNMLIKKNSSNSYFLGQKGHVRSGQPMSELKFPVLVNILKNGL